MTTILSPETQVAKQISTAHKQLELSTHLQLSRYMWSCIYSQQE